MGLPPMRRPQSQEGMENVLHELRRHSLGMCRIQMQACRVTPLLRWTVQETVIHAPLFHVSSFLQGVPTHAPGPHASDDSAAAAPWHGARLSVTTPWPDP